MDVMVDVTGGCYGHMCRADAMGMCVGRMLREVEYRYFMARHKAHGEEDASNATVDVQQVAVDPVKPTCYSVFAEEFFS